MKIDNKKAYHDYHIIDKYTAGIKLLGYEVKNVKASEVSMAGSHVTIKDNIVTLLNLYIKPNDSYSYEQNPTRPRLLLLNKSEIAKLKKHIEQKGHTCIPLSMFITETGLIKVELGLAKGKNAPDKRAAEKDKDLKRQIKEEI